MAVSNLGLHFSASANSPTHTFAGVDIGVATATRRIIVGYILDENPLNTPTVTVGGIAASHVHSEVRPSSRFGFYIAVVPTGTTADIVLTHIGAASFCYITVWRVTGMSTSTVLDGHDNVITTSGSANETITTQANGFAFGLCLRSSGSTTWTGLTELFEEVVGSGRFSGAYLAPTTGTTLYCGVNVLVNINSGWVVVSWRDGGAADAPETTNNLTLAAEITPSIQVTLAQAADPHVEQPPNPCPIQGLGSEVCIVGRTAVPPGYGQIVCGQADYEDPCD